ASEGPAGLFTFLAGEFEKIKEQVLGEVGKAIAEALVIAGIKKIIGIISGLVSGGVGTVVTIVATIIDVVLWFRANAAQLAEVVSTVAGLANAIFAGQVGALANAVNSLLKRLLPVVLSFVGALVGIGGVVGKIQKVFKSIQKPATKAITSLFKRIKKALKGLLKKIKKALKRKKKGKGKKDKKKGKQSSAKVVAQVVRKLKKKAKAKKPEAALAEKRAQAEQLRAEFQPKLERGTLKVVITAAGADEVAKDAAVDFSVSASPETTGEAAVELDVPKQIDPAIALQFNLPQRLQAGEVTAAQAAAGYTVAEFKRQLAGQESGINAMSVESWKKNRDAYAERRKSSPKKSGRDPKSAEHQSRARANFSLQMITVLTGPVAPASPLNLSGSQATGLPWGYIRDFINATRAKYNGQPLSHPAATSEVEGWMTQQAALHDPDQIAGGNAADINDLGHTSINSSIGSQWGNGRANELQVQVDGFLEQKSVKDTDQGKVKMAVVLKGG
ncbi:MAG: hypothetical protein H7138_18935, partial [Myxococcales bacterium]|nr:hypothetical protein [Myxococcales bacterium]